PRGHPGEAKGRRRRGRGGGDSGFPGPRRADGRGPGGDAMGGGRRASCQVVGGDVEGEGVERVRGNGGAGGFDGDGFAAEVRRADVEAEEAVAVVAIGVETDVGVAGDGGREIAELVEGGLPDVVEVVVAAGAGDEVRDLVAADRAGEALVV